MTRRKILLISGLILLVFAVVWVVMILRWRATGQTPSNMDMLLYLVALPLGLLVTFGVVYKTADGIKKRKEKAANEDEEVVEPEPEDDPTLAWQLPVIAAAAILPQGKSDAAIIKAAKDSKRPELHKTLKDPYKQPVLAADIKAVDVDAVEATLDDESPHWSVADKRTLALTELLATRLLDEHFDALRPPEDEEQPNKPPQLVLEIDWLQPAHWLEEDRLAATQWLTERLSEQGWQAPELRVSSQAISSDLTALEQLDELNQAYHQTKDELALHHPHLLVTAESNIDPDVIAQWNSQQQLCSANQPEGKVPGEAAAGLLIAPDTCDAEVLPMQLGRVFTDTRKKPVHQPQHLQADTLKRLTKELRYYTDWEEDAKIKLVSDSDIRPSRGGESLCFTEAVLPEEDATKALYAIGVGNGNAGNALTLATLAVALNNGVKKEQPRLMFSHQSPAQRALVLVAAAKEEAADDDTSTT